jgi:hypothetical protein
MLFHTNAFLGEQLLLPGQSYFANDKVNFGL